MNNFDYMGNIGSRFTAAWDDRLKEKIANGPKKSQEDDLREAFHKTLRACDKAMEDMVDRHLESVAEQQKKLAEYRLKKEMEQRIKEAADVREMLNERAVIARINDQNRMNDIREAEAERKHIFGETA